MVDLSLQKAVIDSTTFIRCYLLRASLGTIQRRLEVGPAQQHGAVNEKKAGRPEAFTRRARVRPEPRLYWRFLKFGGRVDAYERRKKGEALVANSRAGARSLRLAQWIIIGYESR